MHSVLYAILRIFSGAKFIFQYCTVLDIYTFYGNCILKEHLWEKFIRIPFSFTFWGLNLWYTKKSFVFEKLLNDIFLYLMHSTSFDSSISSVTIHLIWEFPSIFYMTTVLHRRPLIAIRSENSCHLFCTVQLWKKKYRFWEIKWRSSVFATIRRAWYLFKGSYLYLKYTGVQN